MKRAAIHRRAPTILLWLAAPLLLCRPAAGDVVRLEALEAQALTRRATLDAARARIDAARSGVEIAKSAYRPRVALQVEAASTPAGRLITVLDREGNEYLTQASRPLGVSDAFDPQLRYGATLSLAQNIYDFGQTSAAIDAAAATTQSAEAGLAAARQRLTREVRTAYLTWLGATLSHRAATEGLRLAQARTARVEARINEGVRPSSDLRAAERHQALAELQLLQQQSRLESARLSLERAVAGPLPRDASPDLRLLERPPSSREPTQEDPELRALRKQAEAALASARAHESRRSPTLGAGVEGGLRGQSDLLFPYYNVGVVLTVPLLDGSAQSQRARAQHAEAVALAAESRELAATLRAQSSQRSANVKYARERLRISLRLRQLAERQYVDAEGLYELGGGNLEAVLEAQAALWQADQDVLAAQLVLAEAALELAR